MANAKNSVGSVDPLLLGRLSGNSQGAVKKTNRKTSSAKAESCEDPSGLDEYLLDDKKLYKIKNEILPARKWKPASKNTVVVKIASTATNKSSANVKTSKNERPNKIEPNGATKKTTLISYKDLPAKSTIETKKHQELQPSRKLRSSRTHEEPSSRSVSDFSIENIAWYYENEEYYKNQCDDIMSDFAIPKNRLREMSAKLSYTYLLLDSRKYSNKENISWLNFIAAIFYIGKGKDERAFQHAKDTEKWLSNDKKVIDKTRNKKYLKIKEIWDSGNPMKVFLVTENIIDGEAFTREAAMINAMGLKRLCNLKNGSYYGVAETLKARQRLELGATLLVEAMKIFRWKNVFDVYPKIKLDIVRLERLNVICDNDHSEDSD